MNGYKIVLLKAIFMLYKLLESERVCSGICSLGTFTVIARTRGKGVDHEKDVNPNQVTSLHFMFTPEYTRPAALGTTRALWQGVEFEKRLNNFISKTKENKRIVGFGGIEKYY